MTLVTALSPRLPPMVDGVGDYCYRLASQLDKDFQFKTRFVVGDPAWSRNAESADAMALTERSAKSLAQALAASPRVILHYVPHGYAPKACPLWLLHGLWQWRAQTPTAQLVTMFHELYALDWHRPWSSDFYLSPVQQYLAAQLSQLSDVALTSTDRYRTTIERLSRGKHRSVPVLPVFSNVGEMAQPQPMASRRRCLVIFGQRHSKQLIYEQSLALLSHVCDHLGIEEIWDIGPRTDLAPPRVGSVPLQTLGERSQSDISALLSQAMAGFLNYDPRRLGKSGIFAAYCAHGVLPINQRAATATTDGLTAGQHYWVPPAVGHPSPQALATIANQAHAWYQHHSLAAQAQVFATSISSLHPPSALTQDD